MVAVVGWPVATSATTRHVEIKCWQIQHNKIVHIILRILLQPWLLIECDYEEARLIMAAKTVVGKLIDRTFHVISKQVNFTIYKGAIPNR